MNSWALEYTLHIPLSAQVAKKLLSESFTNALNEPTELNAGRKVIQFSSLVESHNKTMKAGCEPDCNTELSN